MQMRREMDLGFGAIVTAAVHAPLAVSGAGGARSRKIDCITHFPRISCHGSPWVIRENLVGSREGKF